MGHQRNQIIHSDTVEEEAMIMEQLPWSTDWNCQMIILPVGSDLPMRHTVSFFFNQPTFSGHKEVFRLFHLTHLMVSHIQSVPLVTSHMNCPVLMMLHYLYINFTGTYGMYKWIESWYYRCMSTTYPEWTNVSDTSECCSMWIEWRKY